MATITTTVSGSDVEFTVVAPATTIWRAYVAGKKDHGLGMAGTGTGDYPYFVGTIDGVGSILFGRTYTNDQYSVELWEKGGVFLDAAIFTVGTTAITGIKAVEFGSFWADHLDDAMLKNIAKLGILEIGDELVNEPVVRANGLAYVLFTPSPIKYTSLGMGAGLAKIAAALFTWAKANPLLAATLLGSIIYLGIKIVDWQTKSVEKEMAISTDTTVQSCLNNSSLTAEQKIACIYEYLNSKTGTDWTKIAEYALYAVALFFILGMVKESGILRGK